MTVSCASAATTSWFLVWLTPKARPPGTQYAAATSWSVLPGCGPLLLGPLTLFSARTDQLHAAAARYNSPGQPAISGKTPMSKIEAIGVKACLRSRQKEIDGLGPQKLPHPHSAYLELKL